jgi:hypothetical protein
MTQFFSNPWLWSTPFQSTLGPKYSFQNFGYGEISPIENVVKTLAMLCILFKCAWFMMYPIEP